MNPQPKAEMAPPVKRHRLGLLIYDRETFRVRRGCVRFCTVEPGTAGRGAPGHCSARQGKAWLGEAWKHFTRLGLSGRGLARRGAARQGGAMQGMARHGKAWFGMERFAVNNQQQTQHNYDRQTKHRN